MFNFNKTIVGLDVHKASITYALLPVDSKNVSKTGRFPNETGFIKGNVKSFGDPKNIELVYEAGPCGYELYRQLKKMGYNCWVIAPGLTPVRPGDRVKTDRRDAEKLASYWRSGELTPIHIPTNEEEAARDLIRVREDALEDRLRARHRLSKFLLRQGRLYREGRSWSQKHHQWLRTQKFEFPTLQQSYEANIHGVEDSEERLERLGKQLNDLAQEPQYREHVKWLRCLKGIETLTALTLILEVMVFDRFKRASGFMNYTGLVSSEYSSGNRIRRGSITKVGNAHIRRVLVESAWSYSRPSRLSPLLERRRSGCPAEVVRMAKRAQDRLYQKYWKLVKRGKPHQVAVVAVARELAGFVWAIGTYTPEKKVA